MFNMLYTIYEPTFVGYNEISLDIIYVLAILLGTFVITSKNPIVSVLYLIGLFLSISCYLILSGLNFIGLAYLLVYIGAISILFLFIVMLINVRLSELRIDSMNSIPLVIIIGIFFIYFVINILPSEQKYFNTEKVSFVTSMTWDASLAESSHITSIGNILYTNYSIWLILTSIILLLAMVGCIVITLTEKKTISQKVVTKSENIPYVVSISPSQSKIRYIEYLQKKCTIVYYSSLKKNFFK